MEGDIGGAVAFQFIRPAAFGLDHRLALGQGGLGGGACLGREAVAGGEAAGQPLQCRADFKRLVDQLGREIAHGEAAIGRVIEKPLGRERMQGGAQGGAGDAEFGGEAGLIDLLAIGQRAIEHFLAQRIGHAQRAGEQRR